MDTKEYIVTKLAGPKVAGRFVKHGDTLVLTEPEARLELLNGAIATDKAGADAAVGLVKKKHDKKPADKAGDPSSEDGAGGSGQADAGKASTVDTGKPADAGAAG